MKRTIFKQILISLLLLNFLTGSAVIGQTTRTVRGSSGKWGTPKNGCQGGWSGVVNFSKTLKDSLESDEPGIRKAMDRIKHKTSRNYDYAARTVVDGTAPQNPVVNSKVAFSDTDLSWGQEKVFDTCNSRENGHWFIIEGTDDRQTQAQAEGPARSFNLSVDELNGSYSFNLALPDAKGTFKREEHTTRSGHCQAKNNLPYDRSTNEAFSIKGETFSIAGEKLNPQNPDHISGTKIWGDDGKGQVRSFIYQVTWRFTRCPQKLLITELKFEHPQFPNFEDWKAIEMPHGTIDGNRIKVKAKVLNMSAEDKYADLKIVETYKGDKYNYSRPDEPLPEPQISFKIDAGEEREFEFIWDSDGQAWFDDGRPHLFHRIKAELAEAGKKKDEKEEMLHIAPKPVVLAHGMYSDHNIWDPLYQNLMGDRHSYQWKAYLVGGKPQHGAMRMGKWNGTDASFYSVYENAEQLAKYVKHAQLESNAWHVDIVAHSTGGLVARLYLQKHMPVLPDARPLVKHLIMLGTPNGGVPCIDVMVAKLGMFKHDQRPLKELTNDEMLDFNKYVVNNGGTKLSALAGNPVPIVCGGLEWNDGFVTVKSATYGVAENGEANDFNYQLVNAKNFGNFVMPHLVTGPKRTYPLPVRNDPTDWRRWQVNNGNFGANSGSRSNGGSDLLTNAYSPDNAYAGLFGDSVTSRISGPNAAAIESPFTVVEQTFAKQLKIGPRQTVEIDMPVEAAPNLGVTLIADPGVSVSLLDPNGTLVSRSLASSPLASQLLRMLFTLKPVSKSVWKLKIENTTDLEQSFAGFSWSLEELPK
ncbi:MAG: hypothetical protein IPK01_15635 [Acidobacteria bacterium]|nr:hypothetical protein [Acidobacteriota bacterium]